MNDVVTTELPGGGNAEKRVKRHAHHTHYQASGIEWLPQIPSHWAVTRMDFVATVKARLGWKGLTAAEYVPDGFIFLATPNIKGEGSIDFDDVNFITAERYFESPEIMIRRGDVLIAKDGSVGITNIVRELPKPATVNSSIAILRPKADINNLFLFRWMSSAFVQSLIHSVKDGQGVPHLFQADIRKLPVLLPPPDEQSDIAKFLDLKTNEIDALLTRKSEFLERLREKRRAVIFHAVTRGLRKTRTKASSVAWAPENPEHWSTSKIKHVASIESGHTPAKSVEEYWSDCTIPWISLNDSQYLRTHDYISETAYQINELGLANSSARLLPPRAVVFSRDATVGLCAITTRSMAVSQHFVAYLCGDRLLPEYLLLVLKSMTQELERLSFGATIPTIGMDDIRSLVCPVPPIGEQQEIVNHVFAHVRRLDSLIVAVQKTVEDLKEYRLALITAAVTGQLNVRGVGA